MTVESTPDGKFFLGYDDSTKTVNIMDRATGKVSTRPYNTEELAELAERERVNSARAVEAQLSSPTAVDNRIAMISELIGKGDPAIPTSISEVTNIQHVLNMSNQTLNTDFASNAGRWLKFLVRIQLRMGNALILALRLSGNRFNSADLGE